MKPKRRLKKWVKVMLVVIAIGGFYLMIGDIAKEYDEMYRRCDEAKGYTCDYYTARQYAIRGE